MTTPATARGPRESIAAFAELRARLSDPFADRAAVLDGYGLDERAYPALEAGWCAKLAAGDAAAEELARQYGESYSSALCVATAGERRGGRTVVADAPPAVVGVLSAAGGTVAAVDMPAVVNAPAVMESPVAPAIAPPRMETPAGPVSGSGARQVEVPSFLKERPAMPVAAATPMIAPVAPPVVAPPPLAAASPADYTGTAAVDLSAILKKSVPFDPFAKPPVAPAGPAAAPASPASSPASQAAAASPREPGPPAAPPESKTPLSTGTADVDVGAIARRVLAFGPPGRPGGSGAASPPEPQRPIAPAAPSPAAPPPAAPPAAAPPRVVIRPPQPPAAQPSFTLDQYALLSAEIAYVGTDPAGRSAVFHRFGVTDPDALTAEWRARFAADPALAGRWSAAYAQCYARLRMERGGGR